MKEGTYKVARPKTTKMKTGGRVQSSQIKLQHGGSYPRRSKHVRVPPPPKCHAMGGGVGLSTTENLYKGEQVVKVMRTLPPWVAGARAGGGSVGMQAAATPVDKLSESHVTMVAASFDHPTGPVWVSHVYDIANTRFVFEVDSTAIRAVGILYQYTWEIGQDYDEVVPLWIVLHAYVRGAMSPRVRAQMGASAEPSSTLVNNMKMVQEWWVDLCDRLGWHTEPHLLSEEMVRCKGVNSGGGQKQHVWLNWREKPLTPPIEKYTQPGWEDMIKPQGLRTKKCSLQVLAANFQGLNRTNESSAPQKWHLLRNVAATVGANIVLAQEMFSSKKKAGCSFLGSLLVCQVHS